MLFKSFVGLVHVVMTGPAPTSAPPHVSGREVILTLLERSGGASVAEMVEQTGWQPASVRALLSTLRSSGFDILSEVTEDRGRVYEVTY